MNRAQILNFIEEKIRNWSGDARQWIHLTGERGIGKSYLLNKILEKFGREFDVSIYLDARINFLNSPLQLLEVLKYFKKRYPKLLGNYLDPFPEYVQNYFLNMVEKISSNKQENESVIEEEFLQIVSNFFQFVGEKYRSLLLVDFKGSEPPRMFPSRIEPFSALFQLPIFIISAAEFPWDQPGTANQPEEIMINKLSITENEQLLAQMLTTNAINLRLINNHIYTKAAGNPRKVRFYVAAISHEIVPTEKQQVLEPRRLKSQLTRLEFSDLLFKNFQQLPSNWKQFLVLFSYFSYPKDLTHIRPILKKFEIGRQDISELMKRGWMEKITHLGNQFVAITSREIKNQLKSFLPLVDLKTELLALKNWFGRAYRQIGERISEIYLQLGEVELALKMARKEAQFFASRGDKKLAMDCYLFLKRNLLQKTDVTTKDLKTLIEIGNYQLKLGLYENAFDTFRELRDRLTREQSGFWFIASYQMAWALYQMDALQEVRYLLRNLKMNKNMPRELQARTYYLIGELEENSGRKSYSRQNYLRAAQLAPENMEADFVYNLHQKLRENETEKTRLLQRKLERMVKKSPYHYQKLLTDQIRHRIKKFGYREALSPARGLIRSVRKYFSLHHWRQALLYLSEIESFCGNYLQAKAHLTTLIQAGFYMPRSRAYVQVLLRLGIVEKELGLYGKALHHLEKALEIAFREHFIQEIHSAKLHLGHIYLLVHGYVRAQEFLTEVNRWSRENQQQDLLFASCLFLSAFELQKGNLSRAREFLEEARFLTDFTTDPLDALNFEYYAIQLLFAQPNAPQLKKEIEIFRKKSAGIPKFETLASWLEGKYLQKIGKYGEASQKFNQAYRQAKDSRMLYLQLIIQVDWVRLAQQKPELFDLRAQIREASQIYSNFLTAIDDEILKNQFQESLDFEDVLSLFPNQGENVN